MTLPRKLSKIQALMLAIKILYQESHWMLPLYELYQRLSCFGDYPVNDVIIKTELENLITKNCYVGEPLLVLTHSILDYQDKCVTNHPKGVINIDLEDRLTRLPNGARNHLFDYLHAGEMLSLSMINKKREELRESELNSEPNFSKAGKDLLDDKIRFKHAPSDKLYMLSSKEKTIPLFIPGIEGEWQDVKVLPDNNLLVSTAAGRVYVIKKETGNQQYIIQQELLSPCELRLTTVMSNGDIFCLSAVNGFIEIWSKSNNQYKVINSHMATSVNYIQQRDTILNQLCIKQMCLLSNIDGLVVIFGNGRLGVFSKNVEGCYFLKQIVRHDMGDYLRVTILPDGSFVTLDSRGRVAHWIKDLLNDNFELRDIHSSETGDLLDIEWIASQQRLFVLDENRVTEYLYSSPSFIKITEFDTDISEVNQKIILLPNQILAISDNNLQQLFIRLPNESEYSLVATRKVSSNHYVALPDGDMLSFDETGRLGVTLHEFPSLTQELYRARFTKVLYPEKIKFSTDNYKRTPYLFPWLIRILEFPERSITYLSLQILLEPVYLLTDFVFNLLFLTPYLHLRRSIDNILVERKLIKGIFSISAIALGAIGGVRYSAYLMSHFPLYYDFLSSITSIGFYSILFMIAGEMVSRITNRVSSNKASVVGWLLGTATALISIKMDMPIQIPENIFGAIVSAGVFAFAGSVISKFSLKAYYKYRYGRTNADGEGAFYDHRVPDGSHVLDEKQAQVFGVSANDVRRLRQVCLNLLDKLKIQKYLPNEILRFSLYSWYARLMLPKVAVNHKTWDPIEMSQLDSRGPRNSVKDILHVLNTARSDKEAANLKNILRVGSDALRMKIDPTVAGGIYDARVKILARSSRADIRNDPSLRVFSFQVSLKRAFLMFLYDSARRSNNVMYEGQISNNFAAAVRPFLNSSSSRP